MRSSTLYPSYLLQLIEAFKKLPGVGSKSAERFAFHALQWDKQEVQDFLNSLEKLQKEKAYCEECGALKDSLPCSFCTDERKSSGTLCITSSSKDVFTIEETGEFFGCYYVLPHKLSPLEGFATEQIPVAAIQSRIQALDCQEIILAIDSTIEGDATALFLKQELETPQVKVTRLAFGLPMGSSLEFVDGNTLALAFSGRK